MQSVNKENFINPYIQSCDQAVKDAPFSKRWRKKWNLLSNTQYQNFKRLSRLNSRFIDIKLIADACTPGMMKDMLRLEKILSEDLKSLFEAWIQPSKLNAVGIPELGEALWKRERQKFSWLKRVFFKHAVSREKQAFINTFAIPESIENFISIHGGSASEHKSYRNSECEGPLLDHFGSSPDNEETIRSYLHQADTADEDELHPLKHDYKGECISYSEIFRILKEAQELKVIGGVAKESNPFITFSDIDQYLRRLSFKIEQYHKRGADLPSVLSDIDQYVGNSCLIVLPPAQVPSKEQLGESSGTYDPTFFNERNDQNQNLQSDVDNALCDDTTPLLGRGR